MVGFINGGRINPVTEGGTGVGTGIRNMPLLDGLVLAHDQTPMTSVKANLTAGAPPGASDDSNSGYAIFSPWVDTSNKNVYFCVDATPAAAVWKMSSGGGGGSTIVSARTEATHGDVITVISNSAIGASNAIVVTAETDDQYGISIIARDGTAHTVEVKFSSIPPNGTFINLMIAT